MRMRIFGRRLGWILGALFLVVAGGARGSKAAQNSTLIGAQGQGVAQAPGARAFAVVSVRLSPESEADDWGMGIRGRRFWATHVTMDELIEWAYAISTRQIEHAPEWFATERFDVSGLPETEGEPTEEACRSMLQTALAERFGLREHASQRLLPAYVLSVGSTGLKVPAVTDASAKSTWGVHRGWFLVSNMSFTEVAHVLQRTVFERPVLDGTGLTGRYSFTLRWRADDSQFPQMQGTNVPQESGTEDAEDLYTAGRRQLGLEIEAKKALVPTVVVDAASQPTPN